MIACFDIDVFMLFALMTHLWFMIAPFDMDVFSIFTKRIH